MTKCSGPESGVLINPLRPNYTSICIKDWGSLRIKKMTVGTAPTPVKRDVFVLELPKVHKSVACDSNAATDNLFLQFCTSGFAGV